jgi:uncharacterized protein YjbI with pentapeptide repeats
MKAREVLKKYAAGERNFQRLNLRGQSFKGKNLAGANFSKADIRSTNFTGANLRGANFTGAKCGLQRRWAILLIIFSWVLIGMSALFFLLAVGYLVSLFFDSSRLEDKITGWIIPIILVSFLVLMIFQGIRAGAGTIAGVVTGTTVGAFTVAGVVAIFVVGAYATAFIIILGAKTFAAEGFVRIVVIVLTGVIVLAGVGTIAVAGTVAYSSWCSLKGDKKAKDVLLRPYILAFIAIRGTSFCSVDLTGASFAGAKLKSTDFRKANLTRVRWYGAKMLDRVRPGNTYLANTQVRQWLTGKGIDKNFAGQKLQGINLQGADLTDASFIDANLNEANLQDTDLSRAKLVRTQLDRTDLTGATLTGACIEDWGITTNTKLDDVKCEYVFMRSPTAENPNPCRKPDNWEEVFEGDDFADFIQPIFDTLDLYHNQGVDPRAIAISLKQLAENNPDAELQLVSLEVKGKDNLLLRLQTAPNADKSRLNAEYFDTYNKIKALAKEEYKQLIAEKDNRIQALETMVNTALKRPDFYAQNYNHQGDNKMEGKSYSITGDNNQAVQGYNNQVNQHNQADTNTREQITKAEVIKLLAELEQKIVSSELPEETKKKTLNRLTTVSDDVQEKEPNKELVTGNLKKVTETLAQASKSTEEAKKLWDNVQPILKTIAKWLGVGIQFL